MSVQSMASCCQLTSSAGEPKSHYVMRLVYHNIIVSHNTRLAEEFMQMVLFRLRLLTHSEQSYPQSMRQVMHVSTEQRVCGGIAFTSSCSLRLLYMPTVQCNTGLHQQLQQKCPFSVQQKLSAGGGRGGVSANNYWSCSRICVCAVVCACVTVCACAMHSSPVTSLY